MHIHTLLASNSGEAILDVRMCTTCIKGILYTYVV